MASAFFVGHRFTCGAYSKQVIVGNLGKTAVFCLGYQRFQFRIVFKKLIVKKQGEFLFVYRVIRNTASVSAFFTLFPPSVCLYESNEKVATKKSDFFVMRYIVKPLTRDKLHKKAVFLLKNFFFA